MEDKIMTDAVTDLENEGGNVAMEEAADEAEKVAGEGLNEAGTDEIAEVRDVAPVEEPPEHPYMSTRMMRLDFRYLREWYYYKRRPGVMKKLYIAIGVLLVIALLAHFHLLFMNKIVEMITLPLAVLVGFYLMLMDQDGRKLTASDKSLMGKYQRVTFKTKNVFVEWQGEDQILKYPYGSFVLYVDDPEAILLFLKRNVAIVLPKRDVTPEMLEQVTARLDEKLGHVKWAPGRKFGL